MEANAEAHIPDPDAFTLEKWRAWHEEGQPEPPAELLATIRRRRQKVAETMAMFEGDENEPAEAMT